MQVPLRPVSKHQPKTNTFVELVSAGASASPGRGDACLIELMVDRAGHIELLFDVFASPAAIARMVCPGHAFELITLPNDALQFIIGERHLVGGAVGSERRGQVRRHRALHNPVAIHAEPERTP
jgi:hypothetical protein